MFKRASAVPDDLPRLSELLEEIKSLEDDHARRVYLVGLGDRFAARPEYNEVSPVVRLRAARVRGVPDLGMMLDCCVVMTDLGHQQLAKSTRMRLCGPRQCHAEPR